MVARMAANSTFLVNKQEPSFSTKLDYLDEMFEQIWQDPDRKVVLFSEWTTMLDLIEKRLKRFELDYVRLDGSVPQAKRQQLVHRFQKNPMCRLFMTTNAGSTGLNLQAANTVVNVELPWNPAVLEQRISRAHRMGQKRPVDVYMLVSVNTFEERLLDTLADKRDLALAALDPDSNVSELKLRGGNEDLKRRLETLLGERPVAPTDRTQQQRVKQQQDKLAERQEQLVMAGQQVVTAVCQLVNAVLPASASQPDEAVVQEVRGGLESLVRHDEQGRPQLQLTLPNAESLNQLATTLARLIGLTRPAT
jgi:superfamily II DNA/RNA helicase